MSTPNLGDQMVDKILTQFSVAYRNDSYISESIAPVINVKQRSGKFAKYGKENLRLEDNILRAPGTRARSFDYTVSQGTYSCQEHSIEKIVPDEMAANSDDPYDPRRDATMFALDKIWLNAENELSTSMSDTNVMTQNSTPGTTWDDAASDPFDDIKTARETIKLSTGKHANVAVMGYQVWQVLQNNGDFVDRVKHVGTVEEGALLRALASLLQVDEVLIGSSIKDTANEAQGESLGYVWGKHFWLLHRAARPSVMAASFAYTMKDVNRVVDVYRDEPRKGDVVRVRDSFDQVIVDDKLGYLLQNVVA